jgi:hypothetical protein
MLTMKSLSAALVVLTVSGGVAAAQSATTELKMRSGPGTGYQVIGVIPAGSPVAIVGCSGRWCQVNYAGRMGFANGGYLAGAPSAAAAITRAPAAAYAYGGGPYAAPGYNAFAAAPGYTVAPGYAYGAAPGGYYDVGYASGLGFGWDAQAYRHGYQGWSGGHNDW